MLVVAWCRRRRAIIFRHQTVQSNPVQFTHGSSPPPNASPKQRLKVAYVNKERAAQYEENRFLRQVENDKEQAIADKVPGFQLLAMHKVVPMNNPSPR